MAALAGGSAKIDVVSGRLDGHDGGKALARGVALREVDGVVKVVNPGYAAFPCGVLCLLAMGAVWPESVWPVLWQTTQFRVATAVCTIAGGAVPLALVKVKPGGAVKVVFE